MSNNAEEEDLLQLHFLRSLPRGEFLCEALHHWSATANSEKPLVKIKMRPNIIIRKAFKFSQRQLKVKNFWASEYYFFHSSSQVFAFNSELSKGRLL